MAIYVVRGALGSYAQLTVKRVIRAMCMVEMSSATGAEACSYFFASVVSSVRAECVSWRGCLAR